MTKSIMTINKYGDKYWFLNGERHRENDLPAIEYADGSKEWYLNNQLHRENDLPAVEKANGYKEWWLNDVEVPWLEENLKMKAHLDNILSQKELTQLKRKI